MKKGFTPVTVALMLLSAGIGALAVFLFRGDEPSVSAPPRPAAVADSRPAPVSEVPAALERALRRRIAQLEAELAAARKPATETNAPARPEIHPLRGEDRPRGPREWLENLKKNDPKKYEEHQKRMAQMRERHLKRTQNRLEFLDSIDTSGMSKEERANHEKLQELLARREELPEFSEKMTEAEMREAGQQRWQLDREIRKASKAERASLLKQTATAIGLEGDDAAALTETIQQVIRATESDRTGPPGPPPGGDR